MKTTAAIFVGNDKPLVVDEVNVPDPREDQSRQQSVILGQPADAGIGRAVHSASPNHVFVGTGDSPVSGLVLRRT